MIQVSIIFIQLLLLGGLLHQVVVYKQIMFIIVQELV